MMCVKGQILPMGTWAQMPLRENCYPCICLYSVSKDLTGIASPVYFFLFWLRLVIYGQYCSQVETAISCLDSISKTKEDVKLKLEVPIFIFVFI